MELQLKCNNIMCRRVLSGSQKACVTTCSHIFCIDCANVSLARALVCPGCETSLTEPNDIVLADLNPSEDYKSSILTGLNPNVIIDICSRALSFWSYQTTQEMMYQEVLYKNLDEKQSGLERQLQSVVREANVEIKVLRDKISAVQKEAELEKKKNHDMSEQLHERSRQFQKMQLSYDKLKRKTMLSQTQIPGSENQQFVPNHQQQPQQQHQQNLGPQPRPASSFMPVHQQPQQIFRSRPANRPSPSPIPAVTGARSHFPQMMSTRQGHDAGLGGAGASGGGFRFSNTTTTTTSKIQSTPLRHRNSSNEGSRTHQRDDSSHGDAGYYFDENQNPNRAPTSQGSFSNPRRMSSNH